MSMWFALAALAVAWALVAVGIGISTGRVTTARDAQVPCLPRIVHRCVADNHHPLPHPRNEYCVMREVTHG